MLIRTINNDRKEIHMDLNFFKDHLWDMINEDDTLDVRDIISNDKENWFEVKVYGGSIFRITITEIPTEK